MNRKSFSLTYMLLTARLDMLWLPAAFLALFLIMTWIMRGEGTGFTMTCSYLGAALPLLGGILAANSTLEDPALELQFAAPRPAAGMLLERLGMILVLLSVCAVLYQLGVAALGVDLSPLGGIWQRQLTWLPPTLAMIALGSSISFAVRQAMAGAVISGLVWIFQVLLHDLFLQDRWAQYLLLFMGSNYPENPAVPTNQVVLSILAGLLLVGAWLLLRRQERYI